MIEKTRVFEVRKTFVREEVTTDRIIFELRQDEKTKESEWIYIAPNAQEHTQEQVETILQKLKELNSTKLN